MNSLQQITDAWGHWMANQYGTSCKYTASTNYGAHSSLDKYRQYQCTATYQSINYDSNSPPTGGSVNAYELWYDNNTTLQQAQTFQQTATYQQSFTWAITESLNIGLEFSSTVGLPDTAQSSTKVTVSLGLSSTQTTNHTSTQSWTETCPVNVPADSSVKCDLIIDTASYDINFTASVLLSGYVAIWFKDKVAVNPNDKHWLWFIPIANVFSDVIDNNLISTDGYQIVNGGVLATAQGVFSGSQGITANVRTDQYPLRTSAAAADFRVQQKSRLLTRAEMAT